MASNTIRDLYWADGIEERACAAPTALGEIGEGSGFLAPALPGWANICRASGTALGVYNAVGVPEVSPACWVRNVYVLPAPSARHMLLFAIGRERGRADPCLKLPEDTAPHRAQMA